MTSVAELLALPYNGVAFPPGAAPSAAELLSDDYDTNPFAQGILSADYRFAFYNSPLAKPFRWRRGVLSLNGTQYVEVTTALSGVPLSDVRCLVWDTSRRVQTEQFGWTTEHVTQFSVLPEDAEMAPGDQVCISDTPVLERTLITRQGSSHVLPQRPVDSITAIYNGLAQVPAGAYSATPSGITWLAGAPADGASLSVDYRASAWMEWQPDEQSVMQRGADGLKLPQIGRVQKISAQ